MSEATMAVCRTCGNSFEFADSWAAGATNFETYCSDACDQGAPPVEISVPCEDEEAAKAGDLKFDVVVGGHLIPHWHYKPCPFCRTLPTFSKFGQGEGRRYSFGCGNGDCPVTPRTHWQKTRADATRLWAFEK